MLIRLAFLIFVSLFCTFLQAQELAEKQRNLAGRYALLEQILLRLAETSGNSNPRQAALLKKVLLESKDKLLVRRFENLVGVLERRQLTDAIEGQIHVEKDLILLLKLLESENRSERRNEEKEQIKEFLKELEEILHSERVLKNQTHQHESPNLPKLGKEQQQIRLRTQTFRERLAEHEGEGGEQQGKDGGDEESGDKEQDTTPQTTNQQPLQKALERMKQAEQKLQQMEKEGAVELQEEAIAELQRLKEELEKILRQLREEELMQTLTKLEERLKNMLQQEQTIRAQTEKLITESVPDLRQLKIWADRLGSEQQSVIEDAESALLILREDGTAQAMVEALLQARFDMTEVKTRLDQTLVDGGTLHVEEAVIESLQELLDAVRTAMEESKQRETDSENLLSGGTEATEEPLIQLLAELRMIRSMQRRVNDRTTRTHNEIANVQETNPDADLSRFKQAVEELARQQNRISRILYELKIGKTE